MMCSFAAAHCGKRAAFRYVYYGNGGEAQPRRHFQFESLPVRQSLTQCAVAKATI